METGSIQVSIIIPVYNKTGYMERCINSVITQTYHNIECIIVDDASQDNSMEIAHSLTDIYDGDICFRYIIHAENKGVSAARNTGIKEASGDYILFMDADDELMSDGIRMLVNYVSLYPDIDIVQGNCIQIPHSDDYYELARFGFPVLYGDNEAIRARYYDVHLDFPINAWNKLIRITFLTQNKLFFYEGVIHEDEHWTSELIKCCDSMAFETGYTYLHYIEPSSLIRSTDSEKSSHDWGLVLQDIVIRIEDKDFLRQYKRALRDFAGWYSKTPYLESLKKAHSLFFKQAMSHKLFYCAFVLLISRSLSFFEFGRKVGRHLTNLYIYR